jgi:hypothetical protein
MADGGGEIIIEEAERATEAAPVRPFRRSGLSMNRGPLAPEATPDQLGGEPEPAEAPKAEPDAVGVRPTRRSSLAMNTGPLAPEATPEQLDDTATSAHETTAPAASERTHDTAAAGPVGDPDLKSAINPPAMPTDADGAAKLPEGYDAPESGVSDTGPIDQPAGEATANGDATKEKATDEPDQFPEYEAVDPLHALLMSSLRAPRDEKRAELLIERRMLLQQRSEAMQEHQMALAARMSPGGKGGLISGLLSLGKSDPTVASRQRVAAIDNDIRRRDLYMNSVVDNHYKGMMDAADGMYRAHRTLSEGISHVNVALSTDPRGQKYLSDVDTVATARGVDAKVVRDMIHDRSCTDPDVAALRSQANELSNDPRFGAAVNALEDASQRYSRNAERLERDIGIAARRGLEMHRLDGDFVDALNAMKSDDCALAKPGGERLDRMSDKMKETAEKMAEAIKRLVENILAMFHR